ncbi:MAG TPA: CaiB/BaiF CoA-transferase family protein [Acidimicrobiia bacterium]
MGVRVLELSRYIAAPVAGKALGEMGADVIKIEDPGKGDPMRYWQAGDRPYSPQFAAYNRTKRGITLDLKMDADRLLFMRLVDTADVVLENFRPGVMDRLGVGWDTLAARNPRLVYCAITGFGSSGPYVDRPAYDTVISAMGGMYSQILDPVHPQPVGPAFSDLLAGAFAVQGILAALFARERTGRGQYVDAAMLAAVLGFLVEPGTNMLDMAEVTVPNTRQRRAQAYGVVSRDGLPFVIHMSVPEKFWVAVTEAVGRPELRDDPRFSDRDARHDNYLELDTELKAAFAEKDRAEWFAILEAADVPHGPIYGFESVFDDPQVQQLGIVVETDMGEGARPMRQVGPPVRLGDTPLTVSRRAPLLGEHDVEIRDELAGTGGP